MSVVYDSREHLDENPQLNYTQIFYRWIQQHIGSNDYLTSDDSEQNQFNSELNINRQIPQEQQNEQIEGSRNRYKRHVGLHDGGGVQRVISTGNNKNNTILFTVVLT